MLHRAVNISQRSEGWKASLAEAPHPFVVWPIILLQTWDVVIGAGA
jgi:hypothetical protein